MRALQLLLPVLIEREFMLCTPSLSPLAGALLLALSLPAAAEPLTAATDLDAVRVYGQPDGYKADATRTATKTATPLRDVPQAVTVVTEELIDDQAMTGMADIVRYVPGVGMAQGEGHRDAPIFRGYGSTSDFYVDGLRDDVQYLRDLYNVERVEVLKGPNAMIFGRGGSGGVINRVSKQADRLVHRELELQAGDHGRRRVTGDFGQPVSDTASVRAAALYENSDSFRDFVEVERIGFNPTLTMGLGEKTTATFGYEYFRDDRTTDRGVPSFNGRPFGIGIETFFGNPELSYSDLESHAFTAIVEHEFASGWNLRNATRYAAYDKFYQNIYPGGPVRADGATVPLSGYNSGTDRENVFNQTDLTRIFESGRMRHTLLVGAEIGRQDTENVRRSATFSTSNIVPVTNARVSGPVTFAIRPPTVNASGVVTNGGDAVNTGVADIAAVYVQDQIEFSPQWQAVIGARWDRFAVDFDDLRGSGTRLETGDDLFSPRVGLIYKPFEAVSIYASHTVAYVPRAGEQLNGLSANQRSLDPEKFENVELGAKWDIRPDLSASIAAYRLDRENVAVTDPADATRLILIDGQRTSGIELGLAGKVTSAWSLMGGYAYQDGEIRNAGGVFTGEPAQVPMHSASLWNRFDFNDMWGAAIGAVYRDEVYATTSNTVVLPSFTRVDAAVYLTLSDTVRMQLNVENLFDKTYYASAHTNDNILPGAPRSVYLGLNLSF
jgi:catecholate siderophore receptor